MDGMSFFSAVGIIKAKLAATALLITLYVSLMPISPSFAAGAWTNEPSGFSVLVDCPFSNSLCPGLSMLIIQPRSPILAARLCRLAPFSTPTSVRDRHRQRIVGC